jgi:alpha-mannosidase
MADGNYKMESDLYRIIIDPAKGGVIKSLVAKKLGNKEFVDKNNKRGFNELRGNFFKEGGFHSSMDNAATIAILENGPALMKISIKGTIAGNPFTQYITLAEAQKRIDFKVKIDWKGNTGIGNDYAQDVKWDQKDYHKAFYDDRDKLLMLFPSALTSQKLYKNAPFDVTESKQENTFFSSWDSIKHNIILNWVDVTDAANSFGLALLTDHTTSYVHGKDHPLALTMQYSGMGLWGRNYTITGPLEVNYSLVPHKGKWDNAGIYTETEKWNEPLIATISEASNANEQTASLVNTGDKLHLSSVNIEGNDLLVRVFNAESDNTPKKIIFNMPPGKMELIELDGTVKNVLSVKPEPGGKSSALISVPKFGFRTIRIPAAVK